MITWSIFKTHRCLTLCGHIQYRIAQKFDGENSYEMIVDFKGETLRDKGL